MGGKLIVSVILVVAFLGISMLNVGLGSSAPVQWATWGETGEIQEVPLERTFSLPIEGEFTAPYIVEEKDPDEITARIVDEFNNLYGYDIEPPKVAFINNSWGEYFDGTIYIPAVSEYSIAHETCHYIQDEACHFDGYGESFCEVFAEADRDASECEEKGWPYFYCGPFRLSEVDREGFLDCVFKEACVNGATKGELMMCYNQNKV